MQNRETNNETLLRTVFPEEVWLEILNHLSQFSKEQLFYSHSYFRRLLLPTSHQFLFPELWNILLMFEYREKTSEAAKVTSRNSKLRQVCKHWCTYIDSFRDSYEYRLNSNNFPEDSDKPEIFLDHFRDTHAATDRNPFIGREMTLSLNSSINQGDPPQRFLQAIMEILRIYGQHLWYLQIIANGPDPSIRANYSRVKSWLSHTPNLKSFKWNEYGVSDLPQHEASELEELVKTSPVPRLELVKKLDFNVPKSIAEHFIRINSHFQEIACTSASIFSDQISLPNLSNLYVSSKKMEDIVHLERARDHEWQLKQICLNFENIPEFVSLEIFWSILKVWSITLELVELSLPAARTLSELEAKLESIKGADLNLPKVTTVRIAITNAIGVDYIFPESDMAGRFCGKKDEESYPILLPVDFDEIVRCQATCFSWKAAYNQEGMGPVDWEKFPSVGQVTGLQRRRIVCPGPGVLSRPHFMQILMSNLLSVA